MSDVSPPLAAVIGWPIGHTKSPVLFRYWLDRYGINGHYIPIGLRPESFESGLGSLANLGFQGVNVTIPFKEKVLAIAHSVSDRAALIGAANVLSFKPGGTIFADNTDGYGFSENVRQQQPDWDPKAGPAVVLGAGGAARAVVSALLKEGVPEILIANRTRQRAQNLADANGARVSVIDWNSAGIAAKEARFIVNTTSLGMTGQPPLPVSIEAASGQTVVAEIVYSPLETPLLKQAKAHGLRTVDGLGMLLHQAVPCFHQWFGVRPDVDAELRKLVLGE